LKEAAFYFDGRIGRLPPCPVLEPDSLLWPPNVNRRRSVHQLDFRLFLSILAADKGPFAEGFATCTIPTFEVIGEKVFGSCVLF
jgi:hypothetical protein